MNDNDYIHIESWMGNRLGLRGNLLLCFALIHGYSRYGNGLFKGTLKYLADAIFCSEPTVISCLDKLIELELIRKQKINIKGHERCVYMVCVTFKDGELVCIDDTKDSLVGHTKDSLVGDTKDSLVGHTKDSLVYNKYIEDNIKNNKKRLSNDNQNIPDELFISFWEKYGYKRGKKDAVAAWKKLSKKDKEEAIKAISVYKEDCRVCERQMRQPSVYLNKRTWEDDFTNNGKVSKEEQTEESGIVYPDGIDENQWTKITFWLCGCCHEIAGYISPTEFAEYKKRCKGDSKLLSEILKEINSYVELHGRIDISEKFDEFLKKHLDNEQETGD